MLPAILASLLFASANGPRVELAGDWSVRVTPGKLTAGKRQIHVSQPVNLTVDRATVVEVRDERYDSLPLFDANAAPWTRGAKLKKLFTAETTAPDMLVPESLVVKGGLGNAKTFSAAKDYSLEARWATIGRLAGGIPEGTPVWLDYVCGWHRIDSVVADRNGKVRLLKGEPHNATPKPPALTNGQVLLANIWIPGRAEKLTAESIYPIVEPAYPEPKRIGPPPAQLLLPKTWSKLRNKEPLHILAWGDSVTDGGQASDDAHRYQSRFAALMREQFPGSPIRLTTSAWGGRNTDSFLKEPPDSPHNFETAVISRKPDLIVMEFVNDAWMTPEVVEGKYSYLLKRFQEIGAEWIILTPHYVRPDWMNASSVRVETDPRPYVAGVRQFAAKHHVALADASLRWGHLVKEGIPYITLLSNSINHPDDRGHEMFARSLMEIFR